jgi:hypothetical protein
MALTIIPKPNPAIMEPTKYSGDWVKKKNPTPKPTITPPPMAHVLLSTFWFDIIYRIAFKIFKFIFNY